jgi:hypothetical protein
MGSYARWKGLVRPAIVATALAGTITVPALTAAQSAPAAASRVKYAHAWPIPRQEPGQRASELLARMTLAQKQWSPPPRR